MSRSGSGLTASSSSSSTGSVGAPPTVMTARWIVPGSRLSTVSPPSSASLSGTSGTSSSGPNVAAVDREHPFGIDADEDAGTGDVGRIVDERSSFKYRTRRLDLAKTLVDLVGQFVGVLIVGLDPGVLGIQARRASPAPPPSVQPADRRVRAGRWSDRRGSRPQLRSTSSPRPRSSRPRPELLGDQTIEQRHVLQPAAVIVLNRSRITAPPACSYASSPTNWARRSEARTVFSVSIRRIWYGSSLLRAAHIVPDLLLTRLVAGDGEGHELLQGHAIVGIDVVQLRRHRRQTQALLDDRRRHEMPRGDVLFAHAAIAQDLERAELIERMQADAFVVLGERDRPRQCRRP